nr:PREDICTED: histone-lysine N-methyltransferase SETDB2 [Anolis carolinensis]|eukprot:XP_008114661.2 PREDICTED: histone-lysine N-methyltransferase SETDB2 [Anolis carolinensis]
MEVDAKLFWSHLDSNTVDLMFERLQRVLLSLQQKIKDGTATEEECCQAFAFIQQVDMTDILPLTNVNVASDEDIQNCELDLHSSPSSGVREDPGNVFSFGRMETNEVLSSRSKRMLTGKASKVPYQAHTCSKNCLAKRPWNSYKGENPLCLPLLCHFQRRHAKPDAVFKSHDVMYRAPCGKTLRNFQDVQKYLFQTECNFLFLDHFSFNTYVQVFRNTPSHQSCEFDFDISKGVETVPVSFCNDIDHSQLPYFKYRKTSWPHGYFLNNFSSTFLDSCSCTDGCIDRTKCACLRLTERKCHEVSDSSGKGKFIGYRYKRLDEPVPSGIYECSLLCTCDKSMCQNRLVQHGLQERLQVFNTEKKGWGVRCLDDIDKGTFVCTYSGRLMNRNESWQVKDGDGDDDKEEDAENSNGSNNLLSIKIEAVCSDSQTELNQTGMQKYLHVKPEDQPDIIQNSSYKKRWHNQTVKRPETRTSILQRHRRQLGIADASSDEDVSAECQKPVRRGVTATTPKGHENLHLEVGELVNPVQPKVNTDHHAGNPLSIAALNSTPPVQDEKQCRDLLWTGNACTEELGRGKWESFQNEEAMEDDESQLKAKEVPYLLDATREGNVGRFLNHSCSPNLFVQSVFVETHNRNFPWVAFFTNRHVKAGTELTWDYGYEAGSMPEIETPCYCKALKCRKKILLPTLGFYESGCYLHHQKGCWGSTGSNSGGEERGDVRRRSLLLPRMRGKPADVISPARRSLAAVELLLSRKTTLIMAKMVRRRCAFCPEDEECAIMYVAEGQDLAVHQDCLLYSSGFVESEEYSSDNLDIRFKVASVVNEIKRGRRLMCYFCRKKGATVGCEIKHCRRGYHYFCALCDDAAIETDDVKGTYRSALRVFCPNHDPAKKNSFYDEDSKRGRSPVPMKSSSTRQKMNNKETVVEENLQALRKRQNQHKGKIEFLRKCKQAGLLDEIFEEMLDTLHLAQEKLMDDNTSETEYEDTVMSLFDCGLFENILTAAQSGTEEKIQELLNTRKRLDAQIGILQDLKEVVLSSPGDTISISNSTSE